MRDHVRFRKRLRHDRRVLIGSKELNVTRQSYMGCLLDLWMFVDDNADDEGIISDLTVEAIDEYVELTGFAQSLPPEWLRVVAGGCEFPEYWETNADIHRGNISPRIGESRFKRVWNEHPRAQGNAPLASEYFYGLSHEDQQECERKTIAYADIMAKAPKTHNFIPMAFNWLCQERWRENPQTWEDEVAKWQAEYQRLYKDELPLPGQSVARPDETLSEGAVRWFLAMTREQRTKIQQSVRIGTQEQYLNRWFKGEADDPEPTDDDKMFFTWFEKETHQFK